MSQLTQCSPSLDAERVGATVGEGTRPTAYVHAERLCALEHQLADRAEAGDAEALSVDAARRLKVRLFPSALAKGLRRVDQPPIRREDVSHRELCDRLRVLSRAVGHVDPMPTRCGHIDRVHPGSGAHDQVQVRATFDDLLGHRRRPHDEDGRSAERVGELRHLELGSEIDLHPQHLEFFEGGQQELVGDEQAHGAI